MRMRRGEHFACTGMHRIAPCWARTWPFASLRRLPLLSRSAFWRALRSSLAMCASRSKAAIANSTAVWRTPRWLHCEHEHAHSVAAGAEGLSAVLSACMHLRADHEPLEQPRHQDLVEEDLVLHLMREAIRGHPRSSEVIRDHQGPSEMQSEVQSEVQSGRHREVRPKLIVLSA